MPELLREARRPRRRISFVGYYWALPVALCVAGAAISLLDGQTWTALMFGAGAIVSRLVCVRWGDAE